MGTKRAREYNVTFSRSVNGARVVIYQNKEYYWLIHPDSFDTFSDHSAFSHIVYFDEDNKAFIRVTDLQQNIIARTGDPLIENGIDR
jgi:hypothetical protein